METRPLILYDFLYVIYIVSGPRQPSYQVTFTCYHYFSLIISYPFSSKVQDIVTVTLEWLVGREGWVGTFAPWEYKRYDSLSFSLPTGSKLLIWQLDLYGDARKGNFLLVHFILVLPQVYTQYQYCPVPFYTYLVHALLESKYSSISKKDLFRVLKSSLRFTPPEHLMSSKDIQMPSTGTKFFKSKLAKTGYYTKKIFYFYISSQIISLIR